MIETHKVSLMWVATKSMGVCMAIDIFGRTETTIMFKSPFTIYSTLSNKYMLDIIKFNMKINHEYYFKENKLCRKN